MERSVLAASALVFLLGCGEELWKKFLPKYLEALGAGTLAVGLYGTAEDFLDALYQYPGGWIADRMGRRRAFSLFLGVTMVGYGVYLVSPSWPFLFAGLAFVMVWRSMASPAIFAVIGDALPRERRAMGFTVQSMLKRVPMILSPLAGGVLIGTLGILEGTRAALLITLVLAGTCLLVARGVHVSRGTRDGLDVGDVWMGFHGALKRLLVSDVVIRTAEALAGVFIVLYLTNVTGVSLGRYARLVALQMATSLVVYLPAARIADRVGRKPVVVATFLSFALFPVMVVLASSPAGLALAFVVGGLREIGEPARKAMIVDLAPANLRARTVGLYYLVRSLSITPAALVGGLLFKISPQLPFVAAGIVGALGTILFVVTVEERHAA